MTGHINIAGALHSIDDTGIVAYTGDIYDDLFQLSQRDINKRSQDYIDSISDMLFRVDFLNLNVDNLKDRVIVIEHRLDTIDPSVPSPPDEPSKPCECKKHVLMSDSSFSAMTSDKTDFSMLDPNVIYMTYEDEDSIEVIDNTLITSSAKVENNTIYFDGFVSNATLTL